MLQLRMLLHSKLVLISSFSALQQHPYEKAILYKLTFAGRLIDRDVSPTTISWLMVPETLQK